MSKFSREDEMRLIKLLSDEHALFGQIRALTEKQSAFLKQDDTDAFEGSLDERQELIEKINGLHQETKVLMQSR